jgi:DNA polymerase-3 subunit gamma/tau
MGLALYRKYRSKSLDEIVGQSHITDMLRRAIQSGNVAHAYLLTGPRGVGKTSIARILAHEINGLAYTDESTHLDIIEIDAASNNSVEDIRDLRERVQIAPTSAPKKIYIIDEVHMLSKSAFNALLKTLEEPPEHVVFILATTDVEKLPATIISRTQRFNFRAISEADAVAHLANIAAEEGIDVTPDALALIAEHSAGSFRDSISMLDQLQHAEVGEITTETVERAMGLAPRQTIDQLVAAYRTHDLPMIVTTLNEYERRGTSASTLVRQLIRRINARILEESDLLDLLDALLDTSRSAWPYVKLMSALASRREHVSQSPSAKEVKLTPKSDATAPAKRPSSSIKESKPVMKSEPAPTITPLDSSAVATEAQAFAWDEFLALVKAQSTGTYALLAKSGHTFDGSVLTIYAGKKFHKDKIEKSLQLLNHALETVAPGSKEVRTLATTKAPENSQTAAVLDIMGGGEEVNL